MEERVRSIQLLRGAALALSALILSICLGPLSHARARESDQPDPRRAVEAGRRAGGCGSTRGWWSGFLLSTVAFTAFAFLLHLRGLVRGRRRDHQRLGPGRRRNLGDVPLDGTVRRPVPQELLPDRSRARDDALHHRLVLEDGRARRGATLLFTAVISAGTAGVTRGDHPDLDGLGRRPVRRRRNPGLSVRVLDRHGDRLGHQSDAERGASGTA